MSPPAIKVCIQSNPLHLIFFPLSLPEGNVELILSNREDEINNIHHFTVSQS